MLLYALWQRAAQARAGVDPDESTVMDCDIEIYQAVDADADRDGPGSNRGRTHSHQSPIHTYVGGYMVPCLVWSNNSRLNLTEKSDERLTNGHRENCAPTNVREIWPALYVAVRARVGGGVG